MSLTLILCGSRRSVIEPRSACVCVLCLLFLRSDSRSTSHRRCCCCCCSHRRRRRRRRCCCCCRWHCRCCCCCSCSCVAVAVVIAAATATMTMTTTQQLASLPPLLLLLQLLRRHRRCSSSVVVVVFHLRPGSAVSGERVGGKNGENEPRQTSWLVFRDARYGPPTCWVPPRVLPPKFPPLSK